MSWNDRINLIGTAGESGWRRHVVDSLQLAELIPDRASRICDVGSGGGLPIIPVALLRRSRGFADAIVMIEADRRKSAYLRVACWEHQLAAEVIAERAEAVPPQGADIFTARAVAPLAVVLRHASRHLRAGGAAILPKGRRADVELREAQEIWDFDHEVVRSCTSSESRIFVVRGLRLRG